MDKFKQPHNWDTNWDDEWISDEDVKRFKDNVKKWRLGNKTLQEKITREDKKYLNEKHFNHK